MENRPFFSVVMPVYGVGPYLRAAIDSVLAQTFKDFEILLVNDCSPDDAPAICREYAQKYDGIRVLEHEVNKGLSAARNTGMAEARGQYIWFMDPDDSVDSTLLKAVYDSLAENPAELVVFGCAEEYYDAAGMPVRTVEIVPDAAQITDRKTLHAHIATLEEQTLFGYAWNKMYALEHIREAGLTYETVTLIEDILFNIAFAKDISTANILPLAAYHYAKRGTNSLTAKFVPTYYEVHRRRIETLYTAFTDWGDADARVLQMLANFYVRYIFSALSRNCDPRAGMTGRERKAWLAAVFTDPLFKELVPHAAAQSRTLSVMITLLRKRRSLLARMCARLIYIAQTKCKRLFITAKQARK